MRVPGRVSGLPKRDGDEVQRIRQGSQALKSGQLQIFHIEQPSHRYHIYNIYIYMPKMLIVIQLPTSFIFLCPPRIFGENLSIGAELHIGARYRNCACACRPDSARRRHRGDRHGRSFSTATAAATCAWQQDGACGCCSGTWIYTP